MNIVSKYELKIYDKTPYLHFGVGRKNEILDWLKYSIEPIESYVILDDYAFGWEELSNKLVKTSPNVGRGLELEHVEKCISILRSPSPLHDSHLPPATLKLNLPLSNPLSLASLVPAKISLIKSNTPV